MSLQDILNKYKVVQAPIINNEPIDEIPMVYEEKPPVIGKFINFHHHDEYSIRAGIGNVKEIIPLAKNNGMTHVCITNYGEISHWVQLYSQAKKNEIIPIFAMEAYVNNYKPIFEQEGPKQNLKSIQYIGHQTAWEKPLADLTSQQRSEVNINYHLCLLAQNEKGYQNIIKLHNKAQLEWFYRCPRCNDAHLKEFGEGVIAIIPNYNGEIVYLIDNNKPQEALDKLNFYKSIFQDVYLELAVEEDDFYKDVNEKIIEFAKKNKVKLLIGINSHYTNESDEGVFQNLITMRKFKNDKQHDINIVPKMFYKSEEQVRELYERRFKSPMFSEAIYNECLVNATNLCAQIPFVHVDTSVKILKFENGAELIREKAYDGLRNIGKNDDPVYLKRLNYELENVQKAGFTEYFLFLEDMCRFCRENNVFLGTGRGCFKPEMRTKMADGMYKFIVDVKVGDKIISGKGKKRNVENVFVYDVDEEMIDLELDDGRKISCTKDHEIKVIRNNIHVWVEAQYLQIDDDIVEIKDL